MAIDLAGRFTPYTAPFSLTGQPALSLPVGIDGDGLPPAVQAVGRHGREDVLYALAAELEGATGVLPGHSAVCQREAG